MERKVSLVTGLYLGPHQDEAFKTLLLFGLDLQVPIDPSDKWRGTVVISETTSPLITLARERYLRNYWVYLKSWQPVLQLELDSVQGFSGFFALNYYRFGAGLTFSWTDETELSLNFLPMSSRGVSGEIIFKYLAF